MGVLFKAMEGLQNIALVLVVTLMPLSLAQAEIYKWVDEDGNVHFTDKQHSQSNAREVELKKSNDYRGSNIYREQKSRFQAMDHERNIKKQAKQKKKQSMAKQCEYARYKLGRTETASYVFDIDDKGERIIYTEEQRQQAASKWRSFIDRNC
ncbi:DUF4124 domain-containing protein [Parendozoicomonas haliclonae]|uniref:DUF4124 domain-containing protein n=1 Tax=Parendozoicomonas haliclonae TaxID=1960125 RepID=A0A1X7AM80_9GAMM|nr:DUF4124 domain-containing protein [Parendozoicomonas haliclonae]SMA48887.1 hypothetical protein EHSB41UT_02953 [Parendozoicomonas haliclonae]